MLSTLNYSSAAHFRLRGVCNFLVNLFSTSPSSNSDNVKTTFHDIRLYFARDNSYYGRSWLFIDASFLHLLISERFLEEHKRYDDRHNLATIGNSDGG